MDQDSVDNAFANDHAELDEPPQTIGLNDMIDDCKEMVFDHLELVDLLNMADTNTEMQPMVCQVFERKHSNRRIVIDIEKRNRNAITNPKAVLQLLRNCGHLIRDLHINFALFSVPMCEKIEQYLSKYCWQSLSFLSLSCHPIRLLFSGTVDRPFANVYSLKMESCCFLRSKVGFGEYFPRLRFIQLDSNCYETRTVINGNDPTLRALAILKEFEANEIVQMLKLNPQIQKLVLCSNYNSQLVRKLDEYLVRLECLILRDLPSEFANMDDFQPIHLHNVTEFAMNTGQASERLEKLPFTFRRLTHFSIAGPLHLTDHWFTFFGNIGNCKSIGLFDVSGPLTKLFDLRNVQHGVECLSINLNGEISSDTVTDFLALHRSLRKFTLKITLPPPPNLATINNKRRFIKTFEPGTKREIYKLVSAQKFINEIKVHSTRISPKIRCNFTCDEMNLRF